MERNLAGVDNGWWGGAGEWVAYTWSAPAKLRRVRLVLDSDLSRHKRMLCRYPKDLTPAAMPGMLARDFQIECRNEKGDWVVAAGVTDNHRRLVEISLASDRCTGIRLRIDRSWDGKRAHVFAFDAI